MFGKPRNLDRKQRGIRNVAILAVTAVVLSVVAIVISLILLIFPSQPEPIYGLQISGDPAGINRQGDNIVITQGGEYTLSGETAQGSIVVDANDNAVTLRLDGADIINNFGPAIYFKDTCDSRIVLAADSSNSLVDSIIRDPEADAAIYSQATLSLSGDGALSISGRAQEGIASDGDVVIDSGNYTIYALDDGINASTDYESQVIINDGKLMIYAHGDAIDSNGDIIINGGKIYAYADLQDGSDGLDFDGELIINGGTIIASGYGHADAPSPKSTQRYLTRRSDLALPRDTTFRVFLGDKALTSFEIPKELHHVLYSSPDLDPEAKYDLREVFE